MQFTWTIFLQKESYAVFIQIPHNHSLINLLPEVVLGASPAIYSIHKSKKPKQLSNLFYGLFIILMLFCLYAGKLDKGIFFSSLILKGKKTNKKPTAQTHLISSLIKGLLSSHCIRKTWQQYSPGITHASMFK